MFLALVIFFVEYPSAMYALLFGLLWLSGIGIGLLSEDIVLLLGGYLAYLRLIRFVPTLVVLTLGILAADISGYLAGRLWGEWIETHIVARWKFAADMTDRVKKLFERHGEKVILISRPLFAVRVAVPIFAGHTRMNFKRFFLYDAAVSIPWTVALVSASYYLSATLDVFAEAHRIRHFFFIGLILAALGYTALRLAKGLFWRAR